MKICYLPVRSLSPNPDNFLTPLTDEEYAELRESIIRFGILEPLIVFFKGDKTYGIIAGHYRHRIALEIGLEEVPCVVVDNTMIEGGFDTEIFRRHLTKDQKEEFKLIKEKLCGEIIEKLFKENLLPEFYKRYKEGRLDRGLALTLVSVPKEDQLNLIQENKIFVGDILVSGEKGIIEKLKKEKKELKEKVYEYEEEIEKLKRTLDKAKENVNEAKIEIYKEELRRSEEVRKELIRQIREKDEEIARLKEQEKSERDKKRVHEIERKSDEIFREEKRKNYMVNVIIDRLEHIIEQIKFINKKLSESELPVKDATIAREKIKIIIDHSRDLLLLIKVEERKEKVEFLENQLIL